jgi:N-acyl-D-aspartate/D-glutamate deacylase
MMQEYDLVIRRGKIVDGSGRAAYFGDIAVSEGKIVKIGEIAGRGVEEIDAEGLMVTPGFVDLHTHYDGQVIWDERTEPSASHGVTTVVIGNCGVGFAPCRPKDRASLVSLMEGVEDIPGAAMAEGLTWDWETFPEYLEKIESRARDVDTAVLLPHSCLRVYVMGDRGIDREEANAADLASMTRLAREAVEAGALGVGTSRTLFHRNSEGKSIFSMDAAESELQAIAEGIKQAGGGIFQAVLELLDTAQFEEELALIERVGVQSGLPVHFSLVQLLSGSGVWQRGLELLNEANQRGIDMTAQIMGRPIGLVLGLDTTSNPFSLYPTYRQFHDLPFEEKVAALGRPDIRSKILGESPVAEERDQALMRFLSNFDYMFPLGDPPNYEPDMESSIGARARALGISPQEHAYNVLVGSGGRESLFLAFGNFADGNYDTVLQMLKNEHSVLGLGDGGAHSGLICDGGYPTFMLSYWTRDRTKGERFPVAQVVRWMTHDTAKAVGLNDRGLIAEGFKADFNIIDYEGLRLYPPRVTFDLPGGGRRLSQDADGYVATIVSGQQVYRNGMPTGALPGRLVRGARHASPEFALR